MKKLCLLVGLFTALAGFVWAGEEYPLGPDSQRQPGVPQGTVTQHTWTSKIFPGTVRDYWVYVPAQYVPEKPACVMVFEDGKSYVSEDGRERIPMVFDNLIAKHDMPVTIAILIEPGVLKARAPGQQDRPNRSYEYDGLSDRYARFLLEEILPEVAKHYNLSTNPNDRAISGMSSGGICSFTVAWTHPEAFRRVLSFVGSFADLRGGDIYPALIRKTELKPLRVFLQDGSHDLSIFAGDWWLANQTIASALAYAGYDFKFVTGDQDHDMIQGGAILPDALRWLWRDYPQPIAKPGMHHLGDRLTGFVELLPDWELVSGQGKVPEKSPVSTVTKSESVDRVGNYSASGMAVDQPGNVFFTDPPGDLIHKIAGNGKIANFQGTAGETHGLALGPDGRLYACDNKTNRIVIYSPEGKKSIRAEDVSCQDLAVARDGGIYYTEPRRNRSEIGYLPPGGHKRALDPIGQTAKPNGLLLSPDQSLLYISDPAVKWVWSFQVQADGSLANGEPFFRMETPDESSRSGADRMAEDSHGLVYIATRLGIQICDKEGREVAILNGPESQTGDFEGAASGLAFGGPDMQYLYALVGHQVYRRHLVRMPIQP